MLMSQRLHKSPNCSFSYPMGISLVMPTPPAKRSHQATLASLIMVVQLAANECKLANRAVGLHTSQGSKGLYLATSSLGSLTMYPAAGGAKEDQVLGEGQSIALSSHPEAKTADTPGITSPWLLGFA
jgi:hypothetical protein